MITQFSWTNLFALVMTKRGKYDPQCRCNKPGFEGVGFTKRLAKSPSRSIAPMLVAILYSCAASAADAPREPMIVLNSLANRIYTAGETSGNVAEMIDAEAKAADEVRRYVESGSTEGLLAKEKGKQSPLATAAYMGYPNVVAALLESDIVKAHINDADEMGITPWIAANFSMRQSLWTCNPTIFDDPYRIVPMLVTQPYYVSNPTPPYKKTRDVLEESGAYTDLAKGKQVWLANCKTQSEKARAKVQASTDLQKTLQELGAFDLSVKLMAPEGQPRS